MMEATQTRPELTATAEIVASYVMNNKMNVHDLEQLIQRVYHTVSVLDGAQEGKSPITSAGVSVEESVTPDYIICLEDGKKLKMLKRYLKNHYDMTPEEYRKRWNLPANYPMVAPNYAKKRSELAKEIGLGKQTDSKGRKAKYTKPARSKQSGKAAALPAGKLEIVKSADMIQTRVM
jgi:predicted transcriptional regulator